MTESSADSQESSDETPTELGSELLFEVRLHQRQRLDVHLQQCLGWSSRTRIQRLIRLGAVLLNGGPARVASRVQAGDRILVRMVVTGTYADAPLPMPAPFWEDPYLLAVDKPAGRLVHPTGRTTRGTIIDELQDRYRALSTVGRRPVALHLCHRLDRETSGVLLVAKTELARRALQRAFEADAVRKEYLAVVEGHPEKGQFEVDLPVAVHLDRARDSGHRLARASPDGKPSLTYFTVLGQGPGYALVRCRPVTGRQNQIRVHLAAAGHPILGDVGFGADPQRFAEQGGGTPYPARALLHSEHLLFPHPLWAVPVPLRATPPHDFLPFLPGSASFATPG